ncbi:hypothetical protein BS50DRAFT_634512 [Corynespora cassiicola Philippines]|uniref:Uncharacterized protein n=1 Tax=Corynespora cassiicola Philippines TaxID=1448308 RepID=A0A2T2NNR4_CORCC|nr:hypothetical protein BS50DRAFT_634512 [Corynespora cassiicola Philippines]
MSNTTTMRSQVSRAPTSASSREDLTLVTANADATTRPRDGPERTTLSVDDYFPTTAPINGEGETTGGLDTASIIGIGVGCAVFIIILTTVVGILCYRRKRQKEMSWHASQIEPRPDSNDSHATETMSPPPSSGNRLKRTTTETSREELYTQAKPIDISSLELGEVEASSSRDWQSQTQNQNPYTIDVQINNSRFFEESLSRQQSLRRGPSPIPRSLTPGPTVIEEDHSTEMLNKPTQEYAMNTQHLTPPPPSTSPESSQRSSFRSYLMYKTIAEEEPEPELKEESTVKQNPTVPAAATSTPPARSLREILSSYEPAQIQWNPNLPPPRSAPAPESGPVEMLAPPPVPDRAERSSAPPMSASPIAYPHLAAGSLAHSNSRRSQMSRRSQRSQRSQRSRAGLPDDAIFIAGDNGDDPYTIFRWPESTPRNSICPPR